MRSKSQYRKPNVHLRNLEVLFRCFCFLLSFSFSFLGESTHSFPKPYPQASEPSSEDHASLLTDNDAASAAHHPLQLPYEPEPESSDENDESTEDVEDEWSKWTWDLASCDFIKYSAAKSTKTTYLKLLSSFQNRKTVSLFILYHSWKSFLS